MTKTFSAHDEKAWLKGLSLKMVLTAAQLARFSIRPHYRAGDGSLSVRLTNRGGAVDPARFGNEEIQEADIDGCARVEFNIDYQGNVHPCCMDFSNGYILGNIYEVSLADIWKKSKSQFREHFFGEYSKQVCLKCAQLV